MSKMIRKTLSLVLALSLVYLMSASAFAANTFSDAREIEGGDVYASAYIDSGFSYAETGLNVAGFGEAGVTMSVRYDYSEGAPDDPAYEYRSVTDLEYAYVSAYAQGRPFVRGYYDFYATTPSGGYYDYYGVVLQP